MNYCAVVHGTVLLVVMLFCESCGVADDVDVVVERRVIPCGCDERCDNVRQCDAIPSM
jgi:hypothetical protein